MKNILIHGLGQNKESWIATIEKLKSYKIDSQCTNLFELTNEEINYKNIYKAFSNYCNSFNEKVNLCGLSLGGILAIDYSIEFPERVNSIILIGTPYKIPKMLFRIQSIVFKCMKENSFIVTGLSKKEFIKLTNSMRNIEISNKVKSIKCDTLVLCGEKDEVNMKSSKQLKDNIKQSKFRFIKNAGHEVNKDEPEELSNVIAKFWLEHKNES